MELKVLGSSSSGNCYLLENETECLVIEAGLPFMEVKKALDFNIMKIVGVVASHVHGDHAKYIREYGKAGIKVFKPYELEGRNATYNGMFSDNFGTFSVRAFPLVHDVPCYGFYITHPEIGKLVYASDTEYIKYRFKEINHLLVEANYSKEFIESDAVNKDHVLKGHMELQTTLDFISTNDNPVLENVVLIHLSDKNSNETLFRENTQKITSANVYIADKGLTVKLDLLPF